jgi:WD40 repeat protein
MNSRAAGAAGGRFYRRLGLIWLATMVPAMALAAWLWASPRAWSQREVLSHRCPLGSPGRPLAYSPDGKKLAIAYARRIDVLDVETGSVQSLTVSLAEPDAQAPAWVAWSPDSELLTACGAGGWWIWKVRTAEQVHFAQVRAGAAGVAVSPDSRTVVCATSGHCRLWSRRTGRQRLIDLEITYTAPTRRVRFSPEGRYVAVGAEQMLTVYDLESLTCGCIIGGKPTRAVINDRTEQLFQPGWGDPLDFAFAGGDLRVVHGRSYDARILPLMAGLDEAQTQQQGRSAIRTYDPDGGTLLATRELEVSGRAAALRADGDKAALIANTHRLSVVDGQEGTLLWSRPVSLDTDNELGLLVWSPDGGLVGVSPKKLWTDEAQLLLYQAQTGLEIGTIASLDSNYCCVAMTPEGSRLATMGRQRTVRLWRRGKHSGGFFHSWQGWAITALLGAFALGQSLLGLRDGRARNVSGPGAALGAMGILLALGAVAAELFHAAWYTRQTGSWELDWGRANWFYVLGGPVGLTLHVLIVAQVLRCRNVWRWIGVAVALAAMIVTTWVAVPILLEQQYHLVQSFTYDRGRFLRRWALIGVALLGPWLVWMFLLLRAGRRFAYLRLRRARAQRS